MVLYNLEEFSSETFEEAGHKASRSSFSIQTESRA